MGNRVLIIIAAVVAGVLGVGALTFAGACVHDDGSVSTCHAAQMAVVAAAVVALVCAVAALLVRNRKTAGALLVVAALAGVFAAVSPGNVFALCMMATMRCRAVMLPFAQFMGAVLAVVAIVAAVRAFRSKAGE